MDCSWNQIAAAILWNPRSAGILYTAAITIAMYRPNLLFQRKMSHPVDPPKPFFPFGNPFRRMLPKGSYLSPRLQALLNKFEEDLAARMKKLKPRNKDDVFSLSWMISAAQLLCETHIDIKSLITELELPVCDWEEKWIDLYLNNSVKLLDICIAFSSELSRLRQGQLLLQCAVYKLDQSCSTEFTKATSSLDGWKQHIGSKNPRVENCYDIVDKLMESINLPKVKNSFKGKVLMRSLYGVKVVTFFICNVFTAAFTRSAKSLLDLRVPETHLWADAFADVQTFVNDEIRSKVVNNRKILIKELEEVEASVMVLYPLIRDGVEPVDSEAMKKSVTELGQRAESLTGGLDLLAKEVDEFFQIVVSGRDALLCSLRVGNDVFDFKEEPKFEEQMAM